MKTFKALIKEGAKIVPITIKAFTKNDAKEVVENRLSSSENLVKIFEIQ